MTYWRRSRTFELALALACAAGANATSFFVIACSAAEPGAAGSAPAAQSATDAARSAMVDTIVALAQRGPQPISPRVLAAMKRVPRHEFVPEESRAAAYADTPLPIGEGQTISQPYIVALMTELAAVDPTDTVLEIGTGSGYQAAVLAELAAKVFTIEIVEPLGRRATKTLEQLGYRNVETRIGDGYAGWRAHAPFDAILVTAAPEEIPQPLIEQLARGGKMVVPVGAGTQELVVLEKGADGAVEKRAVLPVRFVPFTRGR
jgi:protein-L-isoaspartate(D-aspartate) O-methyltransferase